jgi:hypothetical protein
LLIIIFPKKFKHKEPNALKILKQFVCSTYNWEQFFSSSKIDKSKQSSSISDKHPNNWLKIYATNQLESSTSRFRANFKIKETLFTINFLAKNKYF